MKMPQTSEIHE